MNRFRPPEISFKPDLSFFFPGITILCGSNNRKILEEVRDEIGLMNTPSGKGEEVRFYFHDRSSPPGIHLPETVPHPGERVTFSETLTGCFPENRPLAWIEAEPGFEMDEAVLSSVNSLAHLTSLALERAHNSLTFHAAAISYRGRCILLPGGSGAGKTTVSLTCALEEWTILTDEWTFLIPKPCPKILGFPRRYRIVSEVVRACPSLLRKEQSRRKYSAFGEQGYLVSSGREIPSTKQGGVPLGAVVILNPRPENRNPVIRPIGKSEALFELLSSHLGESAEDKGETARQLNRLGFEVTQTIADTIPLYRLDYSLGPGLLEIPSRLKKLLENPA